ncbi:MAG: hypothetical protein WAQ53_06535 [Thiofilum sp.]|uniref:hypothetical protein n=1 Tax=Thiofilum sp. TaxID=2212733 RepID=UPI002600774D|nr:hypothetical protein [Thiofilum sp.]MBK8454992.1 hypothetical protein [Thiofilum sp.]
MRVLSPLFLASLLSSLLASPVTYADAKMEQVVSRYLAGVAKVLGGTEQKGVRKAALGDLDNDGDKDLVVSFLLEGIGGGNSWGQHIAVFRNDRGTYKGVTDEVVGGKFFRYFNLEGVLNQKIIGITEICPAGEAQGMCSKPALGTVSFTLVKDKIVERK